MGTRLGLIRQQRTMLRLRCSHQRLQLVTAAQPWSRPFRLVDTISSVLGRLKQHPLMIGLTLVYLLSTPRNRLSIWAGRALSIWEIVQMMRNGRFNRPGP